MTRSFARLAFLLASAIAPVFAQSAALPPPAPAKPPRASQGPAPAQAAPAQTAPSQTIKANAQLVAVDVVVANSKHKPIHGLKATDFTLTENNIPQVVRHFEEHTALTPADATRFTPMPALPPGIFTNYTPAPANGAVNVLLLDTLNTSMTDQAYVRQQLLAYLKSTPPGARIAIFGLTTHLVILQGFTSDPETLKNIMTKARGKGPPPLDDQLGGSGIRNGQADTLEDAGYLDPPLSSFALFNHRCRSLLRGNLLAPGSFAASDSRAMRMAALNWLLRLLYSGRPL